MTSARSPGLRIDIIGDSGPFSQLGKSIGYRVSCHNAQYLIDIGAPVFQILGESGIQQIRGIVATHSHEDHKRWFTDVALYRYYATRRREQLRLISTEQIIEEFSKTSKAALERTLSADSKRIVEVPFSEFVHTAVAGPRPRFRITQVEAEPGRGTVWRVVDERGEVVPPGKAKVVVKPEANRPRMLFRDDETGEWVEPETYYPFSCGRFYQSDVNPYLDEDGELQIHLIKSPAWHGPPTVAARISTPDEALVLSSDTVYDPELWSRLCQEHHEQKLTMTGEEFEQAPILYGEINDYVERIWSEERYRAALAAYQDAVVIHDVDVTGSVVHTPYPTIVDAGIERLLLTHSPDRFVSTIPLTLAGKVFRITGDRFYEEVDGELYDCDADVYVKNFSSAYVGYRSTNGRYRVIETDGMLDILPRDEEVEATTVMFVDLLRDLDGQYFPEIPDISQTYQRRPDGRMERVRFHDGGSEGTVVESLRKPTDVVLADR